MIVSFTPINDIRDVFSRFSLRRFTLLGEDGVPGLIDSFEGTAQWVSALTTPAMIPRDLDDRYIVAMAIEGEAELIACGDRDPRALGVSAGIPAT
jgi:predicted nucleic acid-binding protein